MTQEKDDTKEKIDICVRNITAIETIINDLKTESINYDSIIVELKILHAEFNKRLFELNLLLVKRDNPEERYVRSMEWLDKQKEQLQDIETEDDLKFPKRITKNQK